MLALLAGPREVAGEVAARAGVWVANDNAPGQIVLAGARDGLRRAAEIEPASKRRAHARARRHRRFHSPCDGGRAGAASARRSTRSSSREPLGDRVLGADGRAVRRRPRSELAAALTGPVRWRETMAALARLGARTFIDVGPDQVLARLVPRNVEGARLIALEELACRHLRR